MGHYASEMADYGTSEPTPPKEKVALEDKPVNIRGGGVAGSRTEDTVQVEYALSYDEFDYGAPNRYQKEVEAIPRTGSIVRTFTFSAPGTRITL